MSADGDGNEQQSLGEVARGVHRLESTLESMRSEFRSAISEHVTTQVFEIAVQGLQSDVTELKVKNTRMEEERDRVRLAIFIAFFTALVAPLIVAALLKGFA